MTSLSGAHSSSLQSASSVEAALILNRIRLCLCLNFESFWYVEKLNRPLEDEAMAQLFADNAAQAIIFLAAQQKLSNGCAYYVYWGDEAEPLVEFFASSIGCVWASKILSFWGCFGFCGLIWMHVEWVMCLGFHSLSKSIKMTTISLIVIFWHP